MVGGSVGVVGLEQVCEIGGNVIGSQYFQNELMLSSNPSKLPGGGGKGSPKGNLGGDLGLERSSISISAS